MLNRISFVKKADLFSRPFYFSVGEQNKKKRRTLFGGLLSLGLITISLLYLFYLLFMYFNDGFLPKMVKQYFNGTSGAMSVNSNFVAFQIFVDGMPLADYEALQGVSYFKIIMYYQEYDLVTYTSTPLPSKMCDASSLSAGMVCLDFDAMTSAQKQLVIDARTQVSKSYYVQIAKCALPQNCASPTDISNLVINPNTYVVVHTSISSYNTLSRRLEYTQNIEYFQLDRSLLHESVFSMIRSETDIISGPIIQSKETISHLIGLKRFDRVHSQADAVYLLGVDGYLHFEFRLDQNYEENTIQFPMITEALTQFTSVLNVLLVFGIVANAVAESDMAQDISSLMLKEQYKNTSLELISAKSGGSAAKYLVDEEKEGNAGAAADEIIKMQQQIDQSNFKEHAGKFFKVSLFQRIKTQLFGMQKQRTSGELRRELKEQLIYNKMVALTHKRVDIYELYRDLIKIKMVLKFLLSADQFAAISHCGGTISLDQEPLQVKSTESQAITMTQTALPKMTISTETQAKIPLTNEIPDSAVTVGGGGVGGGEGGGGGDGGEGDANDEVIGVDVFSQQGLMKTGKLREITESVPLQQSPPIMSNESNHLDFLDQIDDNPLIKREQLKAFISRVKSNQATVSSVDERILTALIGIKRSRNKQG